MLAGIVGLLGVTGLAVDFGLGFGTERRAQAAADAAARAGAEKLPASNVSVAKLSADTIAGLNYGSALVSQTSCPSISLPSGSFSGAPVSGNCFYSLCTFTGGTSAVPPYDTISVVAQKSVTGIFSKLALDGRKRATASACPVKAHLTTPLVIGLGQACGGSACFHGNPPVSDDITYQVCDSINGGPECGGGGATKNFMIVDINAVGGSSTPTADGCLGPPATTPNDACWSAMEALLTNQELVSALDKLPRVPTKLSGGTSRVQYTRVNFALATSQPMPIAIGNPGGGGGCQGGGSGAAFKLQGQECPQVVGFGLFQLTSFACLDNATGNPAGCSGAHPNVYTITGHWTQRTEQVNNTCLPGDTSDPSCRFFGVKAIYLVG
jgi:Flp pilus assembly protein TadG